MEPARHGPEQAYLVHGLARPDVAELRRPVGGDHQQRHPPVVRFEHRGVEVRGGGARRAQDHRRPAGGAAQAEREERRRTFVEHDVELEAPVGGEGHGHRGGA